MGRAGEAFDGLKPSLAMILTQFGFAGLNVVCKVAINSGMNPFVMVTYRQVVATLFTAPFAYFLERKTQWKLTWSFFLQVFLCALFGATLNQGLYFAGLKFVSPTIACALNNLLPAVTFLMAIPFRLETVGIRSPSGQAKVLGTVFCVGGAMLMTFYKGAQLNLWSSGIHWNIGYEQSVQQVQGEKLDNNPSDFILGSVMVVASCFAWAIWFILQAKMSKAFSAPYSNTSMLCFMAAIQSALITVCMERNPSAWAFGWDTRLLAIVYTGVIGSGMAFSIMSWCIHRRGPLFVSMFSPLLLIIVAFLGWALFNEKLHLGSVMGSFLIVLGLYGVLWGKSKEMGGVASVTDHKPPFSEEDEVDISQLQMNGLLPVYSIGEKLAKQGSANTAINVDGSVLSIDRLKPTAAGEEGW